jgi:hypothetical protein
VVGDAWLCDDVPKRALIIILWVDGSKDMLMRVYALHANVLLLLLLELTPCLTRNAIGELRATVGLAVQAAGFGWLGLRASLQFEFVRVLTSLIALPYLSPMEGVSSTSYEVPCLLVR